METPAVSSKARATTTHQSSSQHASNPAESSITRGLSSILAEPYSHPVPFATAHTSSGTGPSPAAISAPPATIGTLSTAKYVSSISTHTGGRRPCKVPLHLDRMKMSGQRWHPFAWLAHPDRVQKMTREPCYMLIAHWMQRVISVHLRWHKLRHRKHNRTLATM